MSACNNKCSCGCDRNVEEVITEETEGYTWYIEWTNGGGAGSWTTNLQKSMEDCAEHMLKSKLEAKTIVIVKRKYKDRMTKLD